MLDSSLTLLERARAGDRAALESLVARHLPRLQRWASGRLPRWARDMADTQDLVQETLFQTFKRIEAFEPRGEGALQAYLRQAVLNRIREELRRAKRRPPKSELDPEAEGNARSPLEEAIGQEAVERYEQALARLRPADRELVVARIELGYTNQEIAELLDDNCRRALALDPEVFGANTRCDQALLHIGEVAEAITMMEKTIGESPQLRAGGGRGYGYLGYAYAITGRRAEAEAQLVKNAGLPHQQAMIYGGLGDKDRAFEAIEQLAAINPQRALSWLGRPELALLRGDPRVAALRRKFGLPR
jgi:RNA polymerase sigma factor (sigma-70 family)